MCTRLEFLSLAGCGKAKDGSLAALASTHNGTLRHVNISGTAVTDLGAALASVRSPPRCTRCSSPAAAGSLDAL